MFDLISRRAGPGGAASAPKRRATTLRPRGWHANTLRAAAAAAVVAATGSTSAFAQTGGGLPDDENPTLRQSVTTGNATRQTITLSAGSNPVDITQLPGTTLTLTLGGLNKIGSFPSRITGGRISVTGGNDLDVSVTGGDLIIDSVLGGSFGLVKTGAGTLELTATDDAHNFNGDVLLNQGALRIRSDRNLGVGAGTGNDVIFNGGTLHTVGSLAFGPERGLIVARPGGAFRVDSGIALIEKSNQLRSSSASVSGPLFKDGTGVLRIDSDNSYNGDVTVRQGILELRNAGALGGGTDLRSEITLNNGTSLRLRADSDKFPINFGNKLAVVGAATLDVNRIATNPPAGQDNRMLLGALDLNFNSTLTVRGGSRTVEFTGPVTIVPAAVAATSPTIEALVDVRLTGQLGGDGSFNKAGAARLTLAGGAPNTYTGQTRVTGGVLELAKTPGRTAVPDDLLIDGGTVLLSAGAQIADFSRVTLGGQLGPGTFELNGQDDAVGTLFVNSGLFRTRGGKMTVTGQVRNPGLVALAGDVGAAVVPAVTVLAGGTTVIDEGSAGGGVLETLALIVSGGTNLVDVNGTLAVGAGGMQFTGLANPTLQLAADAGSAADAPGRLVLQSDASFDGASGVAEIRTVGLSPEAGALGLGGGVRTFTVTNAAATFQISAQVAEGGIRKEGPGVLRLTGANTYALGTTITTGSLEVTDPAGLGSAPVTFSGGTLRLRNDAAAVAVASDLTTSAAGNVKVDIGTTTGTGTAGTYTMRALTLGARLDVTGANAGTLVFPSTTTLLANTVVDNAVGLSLTGPVVGGFTLTKAGAGTLTLGGSSGNTQGSTTVNAGTLQLSKSAGLAVPNNLTINAPGTVRLTASDQIGDGAAVHLNSVAAAGGSAATFDLNGFHETVGALTGVTASERVILGAGTLTVAPAAGGVTIFPGVVSGTGRLVKGGNAGSTLNLTGANTFTSGATVSAGTLTFTQQAPRHVGATLTGGVWQVANGGALNFNVGSNITANAADVTLSGATSTFAKINSLAANTGTFAVENGRSFTTAGALSNTGTLRAGGPGAAATLTVSGPVTQHVGSTLSAGNWQAMQNGTLAFNSGSNISTIGGSATVTLSGPGSAFPKIDGLTTISGTGGFTVTGARTFTTAGSLANGSRLTAGPGATLSVNGAITGTAGTTEVQSGGVLTANSVEQGTLIVGGSATARAKALGGATSVLTALTIDGETDAWRGRLDLADTDLVVRGGDLATVTNQVKGGTNFVSGGYWDGPGITSSAAAADSTLMKALGVLLNDDGAGQPIYTSFAGKDVALGDVLVRSTVYGDANLDLQVTGADYALIDAGFAFGSDDWAGGDFDYSGDVDAVDYAWIDASFIKATGPEPKTLALVAAHAGQFGSPYLETLAAIRDGSYAPAAGAVPEPGTWGLIAAGAAGVLARRRRSRA